MVPRIGEITRAVGGAGVVCWSQDCVRLADTNIDHLSRAEEKRRSDAPVSFGLVGMLLTTPAACLPQYQNMYQS